MVFTNEVFGYENNLVRIDVTSNSNGKGMEIFGIHDAKINDLKTKIPEALKNIDVDCNKISVSAVPPEELKRGEYAFPISLAIYCEQKGITENVFCCGNLESWQGVVTDVCVCGIHDSIISSTNKSISYAILPSKCREQITGNIKVAFVSNLEQAFKALDAIGTDKESKFFTITEEEKRDDFTVEFPEYSKGITDETPFLPSCSEKTALAVILAAAGKHNILLWGAYNEKNSAIYALQEITPLLTDSESKSVEKIYSLAGIPSPTSKHSVPFRVPHFTASIEGICGGGINCRPGEVSLAHNGILGLIEATEFKTSVLQILRVPLETKQITLARAGRSTTFPANFQLAMAANSCPCGNYGVEGKLCLCSSRAIELYWKKFSAPLLDRIDIIVKLEKAKPDDRIIEAREMVRKAIQRQRAMRTYNKDLLSLIQTENAQKAFDEIFRKNKLSERRARSLKNVSQTVADIRNCETVTEEDVRKAIEFVRLPDEMPPSNRRI